MTRIHAAPEDQDERTTIDEAFFTDVMVVEENYDGWRLDRFLTEKIKRATRSQVRSYLDNISIEPPRRIKPGLVVRSGDRVCITRRERLLSDIPGVEAMQVLYRDDGVAIVNKPPGVLVHRNSREVTHTLPTYLKHHFPELPHIEAVHRLDRETSGCLLCAMGLNEVTRWRAAFGERSVRKVYLALVQDPSGRWSPSSDELIDLPLGPDQGSTLGLRIGLGTLPSRTRVLGLARDGELMLLELHPIEGRQHQLRAHLQLSGTPIVGDKLYEAGDAYFRRFADDPEETWRAQPLRSRFHCLHAWRLRIERGDRPVQATAPLPAHMEALCSAAMLDRIRERSQLSLEAKSNED